MATTVPSQMERDRRIILVGDYFLNTGYSTRKISRIFSSDNENYFKISNATVCDYINRYKLYYPDKAEQIDSLIEANKGSSIKNPLVIKRLSEVYNLAIRGFNITEISEKLGVGYWTIYYDIYIRLNKIDKTKYNEVVEFIGK